MKHWIIFILVFMTIGTVKGQHVVTLSNGNVKSGAYIIPPARSVERVSDGYIVTYTFEKSTIIDDPLYAGRIMWNVSGFGVEDRPRQGALPYRLDSFTVPEGFSTSVKVIDSLYVDIKYSLSPARPPLIDSNDESYTKDNVPEISAYNGFAPKVVASEDGINVYRGRNIVDVIVYPIQYSYQQKTIRAYTRISYKVTFIKNINESKRLSELNTPINIDDDFISNTTLNGMVSNTKNLEVNKVNTSSDQKGYLILSTPKFESAVNKFVEWKKLLGYDVHLIMKDSWTSELVKTEIKSVYDNNNLYYLLIVGDNKEVPAQRSYTGYADHVTDFYYSCMDGDEDLTPDLLCGRIPVSSVSQANIVVDKIINYEKYPVPDTSFYSRGLNCAYFEDANHDSYEDRRFTQTSEDICNYVIGKGIDVKRVYTTPSKVTPLYWNKDKYSFGEEIPSELKKPDFSWTGDSNDINLAINEGVFYVLHRDHGGTTCWGHPSYSTNNISTLSNGKKLPVVFSLNCLTGQFDRNCFCGSFLEKENGGCVAIYGATRESYSGYNDALAEGMFDAIWPNPGLRPKFPNVNGTDGTTPTPTYELGQILNQGKARLAETYGKKSSTDTKYTMELFHCFGDPNMMIYTAVPTAFSNVAVSRKNGIVDVNFNGNSATIAFYDLITGKVTCMKGTSASYTTSNVSNISVCISAHNKIPYISEGRQPLVTIQNETITGPIDYEGDMIKVGASVTTSKANGPVVFKSGMINLNGGNIIIESGTTINKDTNFKMSNK